MLGKVVKALRNQEQILLGVELGVVEPCYVTSNCNAVITQGCTTPPSSYSLQEEEREVFSSFFLGGLYRMRIGFSWILRYPLYFVWGIEFHI